MWYSKWLYYTGCWFPLKAQQISTHDLQKSSNFPHGEYMKAHHASCSIDWFPIDISGSPLGNSPSSVLVTPQQVVRQCYWRYRCLGILEFRWMWQWWDWPKWAFCVRKMDKHGRTVVFCSLTCCLIWQRYFVTVWPFFSQVMIVSISYSIPTHTYPKVSSTTKNIIISPQLPTRPNLSILHNPISFLPSSHSALES